MKRISTMAVAMLVSLFGASMCAAAELDLPAIHMKLKIDNGSLRVMVQARRKLCVSEKDIFLKAKTSGSPAWPAMEKALKKDRPLYNVEAALAAKPDWSTVAVDFEDEYFYAEMHAVYKEKTKYDISDDGKCKLIETRTKSAKLDDGKFRYFVDFKKGTATRYISEAASRKQTDAILKREYAKNPQVFEPMSSVFSGTDARKFSDATKDAGSQKIVDNQSCTYKTVLNDAKARLCYWSEMNHYPSTLEHPIILKSIVSMGKTSNVKQAVSFKLSKSLKRDLFSPPANFKIEDRTR